MTAIIIYHDKCVDGSYGAWLARRYFTSRHPGLDIVEVPSSYGDDIWKNCRLPEEAMGKIDGAIIHVVDYSLPADLTVTLAKAAKVLHFFDHHKSVFHDLDNNVQPWGLFHDDSTDRIFCMHANKEIPEEQHSTVVGSREFPALGYQVHGNKCGSMIYLEWLLKNHPAGAVFTPDFCDSRGPVLVCQCAYQLAEYIQDRDLWNWKLPGSREVSEALYLMAAEGRFKEMLFAFSTSESFQELTTRGETLVKFKKIRVEEACKNARLFQFYPYSSFPSADIHTVPVVNATEFHSEIGHRLLGLYPDAPFAVVYRDIRPDFRSWSLRSREGGFDVSALAKRMGGGGHACAAGVTSHTGDWPFTLTPVGHLT